MVAQGGVAEVFARLILLVALLQDESLHRCKTCGVDFDSQMQFSLHLLSNTHFEMRDRKLGMNKSGLYFCGHRSLSPPNPGGRFQQRVCQI